MPNTRNNHYVPQWYQEGFFETGRNTLAYLDMEPPRIALKDGRVITERSLFDAPTSRAFQQRDLYSTFFGASINDEIERRLFGDIDDRGSKAIRAFTKTDAGEWHRHFQSLFEYIDIQKIRTPKGLDWLRVQYPTLTQNELMFEMQGIRTMHCTIWSEAVREIVSAENADVKFVISDHPVTIYNHAASPESRLCIYPNDPSIALKGSQTIFPLNRNFCLIFTNLEYARDPSTAPLEKRTFARNYRPSMVRTDAFIRNRKISTQEVLQLNYIIKSRARRFIAAGRKEWLFPERAVSEKWGALKHYILPPKNGIWQFGGEIFAKYDDGRVHYQNEFGRSEKQRDFLIKDPPSRPLRPRDLCGCGYGRSFAICCSKKPTKLRPTWKERSIRERNMMLYNAIINVLDLRPDKNWVQVRRELTDEQIKTVYQLYEGLWPLETDLLQLLPKPDGVARAVYTGSIHPSAIAEFALGAPIYFGEVLIQHPFLHSGTVKKSFSPTENPRAYRQEFLKTIVFFLTIMPLVELGAINLVPDPWNFDLHLRDETMRMAEARSARMIIDPDKEPRLKRLMEEDFKRGIISLPREVLRSQLRRAIPDLGDESSDGALEYIEKLKERDPFTVLNEDPLMGGEKGGQMNMMKLAPNFEMAMYLAQATGSSIVTDSAFRWAEIKSAVVRRRGRLYPGLATLSRSIASSEFAFPQNVMDIASLYASEKLAAYPALITDVFRYLSNLRDRGQRPNREAQFASRFSKAHVPIQTAIEKANIPFKKARISCVFPSDGIQDNTINRLLLMSSSEEHLPRVPMAFFIEGTE